MRYRLFWHVLLGLLCVVGGSAQCLALTCHPNQKNYQDCFACCGEGCHQESDSDGNIQGGGTGEACCYNPDDLSCCGGQISYGDCCNGKPVPEDGGCCDDGTVYSDNRGCCGGTAMKDGQFCCKNQISYGDCCSGEPVPDGGSCENGKVV